MYDHIGDVHVDLSKFVGRKRSRVVFENDIDPILSDENDDDLDLTDLKFPNNKKARVGDDGLSLTSLNMWNPNSDRTFVGLQARVEGSTKDKKQEKAVANEEHIRYIIPTIQTPKWTQTIANALILFFHLMLWLKYPDVPDDVIQREQWHRYNRGKGHYQRPWIKLHQKHMEVRKKWEMKQGEITHGNRNDDDQPPRFVNLYSADFPEMLETWEKAEVVPPQDVQLWCLQAKKDHWLSKIEVRKPTGIY